MKIETYRTRAPLDAYRRAAYKVNRPILELLPEAVRGYKLMCERLNERLRSMASTSTGSSRQHRASI